MQLVEAAHQLQVLGRDQSRLEVYRAAGKPERVRLSTIERSWVRSIIFLRSPTRVCKRAFQKIILQRQFTDLGVKRAFKSTAASFGSVFSCPKTPAAPSSNWPFHVVIWF
jgi:hypothetical protein